MPFIRRSEIRNSDQMPNGSTLVVIDSAVAWQSALLAGLPLSAEVLVLSSDRDGVEQITEALRGQGSVASLHIVAHGAPGSIRLGNGELGVAALEVHAEQVRAWSSVLEGRDLLIYGCRVAEGADGGRFLEQLRALTGANTAASEHRVGRDGPVSNWTLEAQLGSVTTPVAFSEDVRVRYPGHFETVTFSLNSDTMVEDENTPISFNFDIEGEIPPGGTVVRLQAETPAGQLITNAISQWDVFQLGFNGLTIEDVSPGFDFTIFELTITQPNASITTVTFNDFVDDSPQTFVWKVTPVSAGTTVVEENNTVTIYDTRSEVPVGNGDPDAVDDGATTAFETAAEIDVLGNDSDPDEDPLEITEVTQGANGSVAIDDKGTADTSDDTVVYTPDEGFEGDDSFTYTVSDGQGGTDTATVNVTVDERPPLPVVGFTVDTTTLIEDEGTAVTFTFNVENLPPEGVTVALGVYRPGDSGMDLLERGIGDFDFFPPAPNIEFTGLIGNPFGFVGNGGLAFTIGQDGATITLPINDDNDIPPDQPGGNANTDFGIEQQVWRLIDFSLANPPFNEVDEYVVADGQGEVTLTLRDTANFTPEAVDDSAATAFETPAEIDVLGNDSDLDEDPLEITEVTQGANGSVVIDDKGTADTSDDTVVYTPDEGFEGEDSFTYTVSDGRGESATATVTVTVEEQPNQDPDAVDDSATTAFGTPAEIDVLGNDSDPDEDPLEITEVTQGQNGSVVIDDKGTADTSDDTVVYTPNEGFEGDDSFTYTVSDGEGGTGTATVNVTVQAQPNQDPDAVDDSATTAFETAAEIDVLGNDSDPDEDPLEITEVTQGANGSVAIDDKGTADTSDDTVVYTPDEGFEGEDSFTYTVSDGQGGTDTATVNVTVEERPPLPVVGFSVDTTTLIEDEGTSVTFTFNVENLPPEGVTVALGVYRPGDSGMDLLERGIGDFDFFPPPPNIEFTGLIGNPFGFVGNGGLAFTIGQDGATITLPINDDNDIPPDQPGGNANTDFGIEQQVWRLIDFSLANPPFNEVDEYVVADGQGETTLTLRDTANFTPEAVDDSATTAFETPAEIDVLDNDSDLDEDPLEITEVTQGANGSVVIDDKGTVDTLDDTVVYTPDEGFEGEDSFTYTVSDGRGESATATVTVTVEEQPNQDPDAVDDSATTAFGTPAEIDVLGNDSDPDEDPLEITEVTQGENGSVAIDDKGTADTSDDTVVYTPDEGFEGDDSFTYTVSDGQGGTDTATVNVTVQEQPTPPTVTFSLSSDTMVEDENTPISFNFDVTGDIPTGGVKVRLQAETPGGELITNAISQWDLFELGLNGLTLEDVSPGLDFTIFELTITDPNASITTVTFNDFVDDSPQTFVWKVTPVTEGTTVIEENNVVTIYDTRSEIPGENSPPDAVDDAVSGTEDAPIEGNVLADNDNGPDSDPDAGDTLTVSRVNGQQASVGTQITLASGALLTLNADGAFAYDPDDQFEFLAVGESETDSFTYEVSDGNGGTDTATVTVTIDGVNDDPTAADDGGTGFVTDEDDGFTTGNVLDNDSDVDASDSLSVEGIDTSGTLGLVTDNGDGTFDYDPNGQFEGLADGETATDSFTYTVSDGNGGTSTATVTVTIDGADEEPNVIEGEEGNDNLVGTPEDDLLVGNGGAFDFFSGGGGSDIFRFNATNGNGREVGTITDYTPGEDFIDLGDSTISFSFDAGAATYLFLEGGDFDTLIVNGASSINEISFV